MINLKCLFLVSLLYTFNPLNCSYLDIHAKKNGSTATDEKPKVSSFLTPATQGSFEKNQTITPQAQPSNIFTKAWYGTSKHIAGKTAFAIFMELYKNKTIEADYHSNRCDAINRFNEACEERFTKKDLSTAEKQSKIKELIEAATSINEEFALAKALSAQYYTLQKKALNETLKAQANTIEPKLREERNRIIKEADEHYIEQLKIQLHHAQDAATNSRYLYKHGQLEEDFTNQNENHFKNIEKFSQLLQTINSSVEIANDVNLHHLPKK